MFELHGFGGLGGGLSVVARAVALMTTQAVLLEFQVVLLVTLA
jgi:hypothetical protein